MSRTVAKSSTRKSASRSLVALLVLILGLGALAGGMAVWGSGQLTPRLGLDLEGGTEMVLEPVLVGNEQVSEGQVTQAVDIIRQRIDANGVSEAEISTQGGKNIVVSIPGTPSAEQLDAIRKPSQLRFRAVFVENVSAPTTSVDPSGTPTPSGTATTPATGTPSATSPDRDGHPHDHRDGDGNHSGRDVEHHRRQRRRPRGLPRSDDGAHDDRPGSQRDHAPRRPRRHRRPRRPPRP